MHAVECAGEDQEVVDGGGGEEGGESAIEDEAAGFVDDDEGVDDPAREIEFWLKFDGESGRGLTS